MNGVVSLENLAKNINLVEGIHNVAMVMLSATNSTGNLSSSAYVALNNLAKTYNFTGEELESAKLLVEQFKLSGVNIFMVSTYELEKEERDWAATVFVAVAGIAFIYTGLWLINLYGAVSTFAATLGSSLVLQGTGDIIKSLIAVGTGNPVDYYRYINEKGMSVGIAILTAGFLEGLSTIADFSFLKDGAEGIFNAAQNTGTFLTKIALTQAATLGTNAVLQNVAKNFIDSDDIAAEAQQEIKTITEGSYREKLAIIYATDKIHEDTTLQHRLLSEIRREASEYLGKYHDDKTEFATGVGTNVVGQVLNGISGAFGLGDLLNVGAEVTKGLIKNSKVISAMSGAIRRAIDNVVSEALSSGAMMKDRLNKNYRTDIADQLFAAMEKQEFVNNGEIDYKNCNKLNGVKLEGAFAGHNLVGTCESVADLLLNAVNYDVLNGQLIGVVSRLKELIQENDIVAPTTGAVAGKIGRLIAHTVEFTSEKVEELKQARAEGGSEKEDKLKFDQERERSQRETAQKSGLNEKPETGKESGQGIPGQEKSAGNNNEQDKGKGQGEKPQSNRGEPGAEQNEYNDLVKKIEELGIFGAENGESISRTMYIESNGKKYVVFAEGTRIYGKDGNTVIKEEIYLDAIEMKTDEGITYKMENSIGVNGKDSGRIYNRFSLFISNDGVTDPNDFKFMKLENEVWNGWNDAFGLGAFSIGPKAPILNGLGISPINIDCNHS